MNELLKKHALVGKMLGSEVQIDFISEHDLLILHDQVISAFGGSTGVRDQTLLISALHRPMNAVSYDNADLIEASALLCHSLIKNHAFVDGNKRTGFYSMLMTLDLNGYGFECDPADTVYAIKKMAASEIEFTDFEAWVRQCAYSYKESEKMACMKKNRQY